MMARILLVTTLSIGMIVGVSVGHNEEDSVDDDQRTQLWKQVEAAQKKSLPKTATAALDKIYKLAIAEKQFPEAIRAVAKKYVIEGQINQPAEPYVIRKLQTDMDKFPSEVRPVMQVILANWFYSYYQSNRWRFAQRSQTSQAPSEDFETWDLSRLLNQIDDCFTAALASADELKRVPIGQYENLLREGTVADSYRPTLYDFLAFQSLEFYSLDEQIIRRQGAFDVGAGSPIFGSVEDFLKWAPKSEDEDSFLLRAVQLYQALLRFHQADQDPAARLDADLHRIRFGNVVAVGTEKTARYQAALRRFADRHAKHPLSSGALLSLATSHNQEGDSATAHKIAREGQSRFPERLYGKQCFNLIQQIESQHLKLATQRVWTRDREMIEVSYRNLEKVHFRLVPFNYSDWRWGGLHTLNNLRGKELETFLKQPATKSWTSVLPRTEDFQIRNHELDIASDLEPGCYLLVASVKQDFSEKSNVLSICEVWKSQLAVVSRNVVGSSNVVGQVLDAESGQMVAGASVNVSSWKRAGRSSRSVDVGTVTTDQNGFFEIAGALRGKHRVIVSHKGDQFGYVDHYYKYKQNERERPNQQTVFFTDRSIYRPGQTVQFKGVCIASDTQKNKYETIVNQEVEVVVRDVNGETIQSLTLRTNEFGSFHGSVTAPRDRATGQMQLVVTRGPSGAAVFRVEEYKRPKFLVEVEKPEAAFQLRDEVKVRGTAKAYTGAPVDGAKVSWRVVREVRYPDWWMWRCWWCLPVQGESAEIANGSTSTEVDGSFSIPFVALPDESVDREGEPVFTYTIYADVTDTTGETRSDRQQIRLGYTSIQASLSCDDWQVAGEPVGLNLKTRTLDGESIAARGTLKIYRLQGPDEIQRSRLAARRYNLNAAPRQNGRPDLSKVDSWPLGELLIEQPLETDASGEIESQHALAAGAYKAIFEATDKSGNPVRSEKPLLVLDLAGGNFDIKVPHHFQAKRWNVDVGDEFIALWGTGYGSGRAYVEIEHRGKLLKTYWTDAGSTQAIVKWKITEALRGGFWVRVTYFRENRAYIESRKVEVPWSNKKLNVKWEHFVSKLKPGNKETWTAVVSGPGADQTVAEMVATMYDASLDAYLAHRWPTAFNVFFRDDQRTQLGITNQWKYFRPVISNIRVPYKSASIEYRHFEWDVAPSMGRAGWRGGVVFGGGGGGFSGQPSGRVLRSRAFGASNSIAAPMESVEGAVGLESAVDSLSLSQAESGRGQSQQGPAIDLSNVSARKNLNETAFYFPNLTTDTQGNVRIEFEVPEALTQWKVMGFAHDNELRTALLTEEAVTSKDLMVQPNPPRFLREGDVLEFSVKVTNQSATRQQGEVELSFADAATENSMDEPLGNSDNQKGFDIPAGQSKSLYWRLEVPDFVGVLTYKAVGGTSKLSDGEEGLLPILSKRILVTESLPLPIRGNQTREFNFDRLERINTSDSLISQTYTVQMCSNPSWYAVMALPYLMEYPHQCSEQVFNRLYANSIGNHIVKSNPRVKRIFDQWQGSDALDSPLEKNEEIRNVLIAESPWLKDAKEESQARRDVAVLFDQNRLDAETRRALEQLKQMQYSDGAWPWFPQGRANDYITLYVVTGFGRLRHLGVGTDVSPAIKALDRLDHWIHQSYQRILEQGKPELNHLTPTICFYMYGRSFFLKDTAVNKKYKTAVDYYLGQAKRYWPEMTSRQSQGHLAIGLKRFGDLETPQEIMKSLTERSQSDDELGMYWQEDSRSWWWHRAPIETQALLIEAYDEVLADANKVEECKIWLLKQKQTQNWKTTKATADAVYALLMRGMDRLASSSQVQVKLDGELIEASNVEAGTGFYQERLVRQEITPAVGKIQVSKKDDGIAWGSVHWQYLEDVGKIEPYEGTPLTLKKQLYIKKNTGKGPVIQPVEGPVEVGDELITRVEVRVDRDMEYVHLKDYRGSGTEPVNVLSRYKFQDGLAYYESTKDTASHFFIDFLPRGTYVFEYSTRVQHRGKYETGIAELQCMYAPEFNSHSNSVAIFVE